MIRAIFFDLDGTLLDRASAHRRYCLDLIGRRPDVFHSSHRDGDLRELTRDIGDLDWDRRAFGRRTASRFPALGLTGAAIARDHRDRLVEFVEPDPEVVRLLANLADRRRLAIVSNGSSRSQRAKLERLGLGSIRAFISGELGLSKPDPALFEKAIDWADCRPSEALFVGDNPALDIVGPASVGMATCWIAAGRTYPPRLPEPDRTIQRLADLDLQEANR